MREEGREGGKEGRGEGGGEGGGYLKGGPVFFGLVDEGVKSKHVGDTLTLLADEAREGVSGGETDGGVAVARAHHGGAVSEEGREGGREGGGA